MAEAFRSTAQARNLEFIAAHPAKKPSREDQRRIKSHVARGRPSRRDRPQVKSWILQRKNGMVDLGIPARVGSDLSLLGFPEPLKPYMEEDIVRSFYGMKGTLYPSEICLQVEPSQSSWTTNLLSDLVYFHSAIFSIESYLDDRLGREQGTLSQFHFLKTLRLLQERINDPKDPKSISDATIMVVVILGLTAELIGDRPAAENHLAGMARIVSLRGGLEMLRFDNSRLPAKVCRVDLGLVLRFGCRPVFFAEEISWDPYIAGQGLIRGVKKVAGREAEVSKFVQTLDERLINIWKDLQDFSRLANLAHQTTHKLPPNTFSEIMVSVLYRLLALSFLESPIEDALRLGMMAFSAAIFFRWRGMKQRQQYLDDSFRDALLKLNGSSTQPPLAVLLWLLMTWSMNVSGHVAEGNVQQWLDDLLQSKFHSWTEAHDALKSVMWIDCMHNAAGKQVFEAAMKSSR
ncbi:hypothetical protein ACJZ2D_001075 [Fusarium nematophilum]